MKLKKVLVTMGIILLAVFLITGCSSDSISTDDSSDPGTSQTTISGTVLAPVDSSTVSSQNLTQLNSTNINEEPLINAEIVVKRYSNGSEVANSITDEDGNYTVTGIPEGTDVVVMAVKNLDNGETIRISGIIPEAGKQDEIGGNINFRTSLAAESLGKEMGEGKEIDPIQMEEALERANRQIDEQNVEIDVSTDGNVFGKEFGQLNNKTIEESIRVVVEEISGDSYSNQYFNIDFPDSWYSYSYNQIIEDQDNPEAEKVELLSLSSSQDISTAFFVIRTQFTKEVSELNRDLEDIGDEFRKFVSSEQDMIIEEEGYTTVGGRRAYTIELKNTTNQTFGRFIYTYKGNNFYNLFYAGEYGNEFDTCLKIRNSFEIK